MNTYSVVARRWLKQHVDAIDAPNQATEAQASAAFERLRISTPWREAPREISAVLPATGSEATDANLPNMDWFDAYAFCAEHANSRHRLRMGAVGYSITLPDVFIGATLKGIRMNLFGDPFLPDGARAVVVPSADGSPTNDWSVMVEGDVMVSKAVVRQQRPCATPSTPNCIQVRESNATYSLDSTETPPAIDNLPPGADAVIAFPSGGVTLDKYLWIYLTLENYEHVRNSWVEGSAMSNSTFEFDAEDTLGVGLPPSGELTEEVPDGEEFQILIGQAKLVLPRTDSQVSPVTQGPQTNLTATIFGTEILLTASILESTCLQPDATSILGFLLNRHGTRQSQGGNSFMFAGGISAYSASIGRLFPEMCPALGLAAMAVYVKSGDNYIPQYMSTYVSAWVGRRGVFRKLILRNTHKTLSVVNAKVILTPWFVPGEYVTDTFIHDNYKNGLIFSNDFWNGRTTKHGNATRIGLPFELPNQVVMGQDYTIPVEFNSGIGGMVVITAHISEIGTNGTPIGYTGTTFGTITGQPVGLFDVSGMNMFFNSATLYDWHKENDFLPAPATYVTNQGNKSDVIDGWKPDIYLA